MKKDPELAKKYSPEEVMTRRIKGQLKKEKKQFRFDLDSFPSYDNVNKIIAADKSIMIHCGQDIMYNIKSEKIKKWRKNNGKV